MIADLDTLLTALYVELTDRIIPSTPTRRRGPGRPPQGHRRRAGLLALAQVLLRFNDERHWLRAAPSRVGHLFPRLLSQSEYNDRAQDHRLADGGRPALAGRQDPGLGRAAAAAGRHPGGMWPSTSTVKRSDLFGHAGYGYETSHSRFYWGAKLMLIVSVDGTVTGFGLANPKLWASASKPGNC